MKKIISLLLSVIMLLSLCSSFAFADDENTLIFWSNETAYDGYDEWIALAEERTGLDIIVKALPQNQSEKNTKIITLLTGGAEADIVSCGEETLVALKTTDTVLPVDEVMTDEIMEQLPEGLKNIISYDGSVYGVPTFMEFIGLWADQSKIEALGYENLEDEEAFMNYLKTYSTGDKWAYGGSWAQNFVYNEIGVFIYLFGGDFFDFTNPNTRAAVQFMYDMVKDGYTPIANLADEHVTTQQKMFDDIEAATITYCTYIQNFVNAGAYSPTEKLHITPLPKLSANTSGEIVSYCSGWFYGVSSASNHPEAVKKFLDWAITEEAELAYYECTGLLPARIDVLNSENLNPSIWGEEGLDDIRYYMNNYKMIQRPIPTDSLDFIANFGALFQKFISDDLTLDQYCEQAQALIDEAF